MITAATLTDEQIRELHMSLWRQVGELQSQMQDCVRALPANGQSPGIPTVSRMNARARCAEILNARKAGAK